jgi:multiple sugar transport system permease protein
MARYFNPIVVVLAAVALVLGSMAGFALSHARFRGSRILFLGFLAALFVPFQVIMCHSPGP